MWLMCSVWKSQKGYVRHAESLLTRASCFRALFDGDIMLVAELSGAHGVLGVPMDLYHADALDGGFCWVRRSPDSHLTSRTMLDQRSTKVTPAPMPLADPLLLAQQTLHEVP